MRFGRALAGTFAALGVMAAGCTETSSGEPTPGDGETEVPGSSSAQRPQDVSLEGLDPCSLIPESDWSKFFIEEPGSPGQNETFGNAPDCVYTRGDGPFGVVVTLVTTEGVDVWLNGRRAEEVERVDPVLGFSTLYAKNEINPDRCDLIVDAADGQYLMAAVTPWDDSIDVAESCKYARQVAELAMSTVVGS